MADSYSLHRVPWIPASAGMTVYRAGIGVEGGSDGVEGRNDMIEHQILGSNICAT